MKGRCPRPLNDGGTIMNKHILKRLHKIYVALVALTVFLFVDEDQGRRPWAETHSFFREAKNLLRRPPWAAHWTKTRVFARGRFLNKKPHSFFRKVVLRSKTILATPKAKNLLRRPSWAAHRKKLCATPFLWEKTSY